MGYLTPQEQDVLAIHGLMPTDVTILETLAYTGGQPFGKLAGSLGYAATITIRLGKLRKEGFVIGPDPKSRLYSITDSGRKKLEKII